jgi:hypothetical protein
MNKIWQKVSAEPAAITGAVMAIMNVVAVFGLWAPTPAQLAAINTALAAVFAAIVRATVDHKHGTPVRVARARPRRAQRPGPSGRETMSEPV